MKMIPRFDGREDFWWLINVEQYFEAIRVREEEKLSWVWMALRGDAFSWWFS